MEQELQNRIEQLEQQVNALTGILNNHHHTGADGSSQLKKTMEINPGEYFRSGSFALEGTPYLNDRVLRGGLILGNDKYVEDGSGNSQMAWQHQLDANNTFIFGQRAPIYAGSDADVTSGGTTLSQSSYTFETNELAGAYVVVYSSPTVFDVYEIASNTSSNITITGGTWSFTKSDGLFFVYMPIYWGSAEYPWRRLYTMDGVGGGVRFGRGQTNAGQQDNGLLYSDSAGDLYWRNYAGTSVKLN